MGVVVCLPLHRSMQRERVRRQATLSRQSHRIGAQSHLRCIFFVHKAGDYNCIGKFDSLSRSLSLCTRGATIYMGEKNGSRAPRRAARGARRGERGMCRGKKTDEVSSWLIGSARGGRATGVAYSLALSKRDIYSVSLCLRVCVCVCASATPSPPIFFRLYY